MNASFHVFVNDCFETYFDAYINVYLTAEPNIMAN